MLGTESTSCPTDYSLSLVTNPQILTVLTATLAARCGMWFRPNQMDINASVVRNSRRSVPSFAPFYMSW